MPFCRRTLLAALAALGLAAGPVAAQNDAPIVAAASDLQFAVREIANAFTADTGRQVRLSFGSTGNFARQIREGAPFQIFMAADEQFIFDLARDGFARDKGDLYAVGRIVVKAPTGSTLKADGTLESLRQALAEGKITRFAIANPDHAPYGMRAREALQHAGLWEQIQRFLVLGENVSQAAQFALSGNAEGGIIALSLSMAPELRDKGTADLIPENFHEPLRQRMALLKGAGPVAEAFYAYMKEPRARGIMERYGFVLPASK
jgi:molybdate transport system substrate-binding protein